MNNKIIKFNFFLYSTYNDSSISNLVFRLGSSIIVISTARKDFIA